MEYQIRQFSLYAEGILKHLTSGTIHSVYRRTINLTDGKQILSLQAEGSPLSPISLISGLSAEDMDALHIRSGDPVHFTGDGFTLPGSFEARDAAHHFTCANARRYDLKLSGPLDNTARLSLASAIRTALSYTSTGGFALLFSEKETETDDLSLILFAARNYILHCNELCLRRDYREAALTLSRLLGLGIGLTPSGDDFLCGVLAGLHLAGKDGHSFTQFLRSMIAARLSDTIDISAAFLSCALENQFSLPVNSLCCPLTPEEILSSFEEIGHSSGTDTLCGILWSLRHI